MRLSPIGLRTAAVLLILAAASLHAGDGTTDLRLNPAATTTISTPGSYTLVGDVTMATGIGAILVTASDVTIDLNGHTIASAGGGAAAHGIDANTVVGLCVHSGTVRGFTGTGIRASSPNAAPRIHDVRVRGCATGIGAGISSVIRDCVVTGCSGYGIIAGDGSLVEGCDASGNNTAGGFAGIYVGLGAAVRNCVALNNVGPVNTNAIGILTLIGCTLDGNTCNGNSGSGTGYGRGIHAGNGCTILHNTTMNNLGGGSGGSGYGIFAGSHCTINLNTATGNKGGGSGVGRGIQAGSDCAVTNNTANDNDAGATGTAAYGIEAGANCAVSGNTCNKNEEGSGAVGTSHGIWVGPYGLVENNNCAYNNALTDGSARGISAGFGSTIRNNKCSSNSAAGTGSSYGIEANGHCDLEGNTCKNSHYGIMIPDINTTVIRNVTSGNSIGGIAWSAGGMAGRSEQNRMGGGDGPIVNPPTSVGTGELADVDF